MAAVAVPCEVRMIRTIGEGVKRTLFEGQDEESFQSMLHWIRYFRKEGIDAGEIYPLLLSLVDESKGKCRNPFVVAR